MPKAPTYTGNVGQIRKALDRFATGFQDDSLTAAQYALNELEQQVDTLEASLAQCRSTGAARITELERELTELRKAELEWTVSDTKMSNLEQEVAELRRAHKDADQLRAELNTSRLSEQKTLAKLNLIRRMIGNLPDDFFKDD